MSENVLSYGIMAVLKTPTGGHMTDEWEELSEELYDGGLHLNYEGTLVFSDIGDNSDCYGLVFADRSIYEDFDIKMASLGLEYEYPKAYSCVWYNGSDSDMSMMKKENFRR